jgi:hydroxymethylpyrimidine/phosphomethylpyrimidine kinase
VTPIVLTVAGSDPSGGAGLQADLKTIHRHEAYGAAVATLITVQNTRGVERVDVLSAELVRAQLDNLLSDMAPQAAKTGALGSREVVDEVGAVVRATSFPWVVDPVWVPTRGRPLSNEDLGDALRSDLIPFAALVTPNAEEASGLAGISVRTLDDAREAAARIASLGAKAVLVTGGDLEGAARGTDVLFYEGAAQELRAGSVVEGEFHGTGCTLSAAIATRLAFGDDIPTAVVRAKAWLDGALAHAFAVGKGARPVNHLWKVDRKP